MSVKTVAILSPGDMGHAVGRALGEHGLDVITCLQGRSERTRKLAQQGNIRDVPSLEEMVTQADLILSILVPEEALGVARSVANALQATGQETTFADCNAVSPGTSEEINSIITSTVSSTTLTVFRTIHYAPTFETSTNSSATRLHVMSKRTVLICHGFTWNTQTTLVMDSVIARSRPKPSPSWTAISVKSGMRSGTDRTRTMKTG